MSKKQISHRHHFLPRFLLEGFAMDDGRLWVYDRLSSKFWKTPAFPRQIFWREDQNTFTVGEEQTDFVEDIYTKVDTDFSVLHAKLLQMPGPVVLTQPEVVELIKFIAVSYYRVPASDQFIKDYVLNTPPEKLGFKIVDKANNTIGSPELYRQLFSEPAFIEGYRISKAALEMAAYTEHIELSDWSVAAPANLTGFGLIGDNPVILREDFSGYVLVHQLIMPLSRCHVAYHRTGEKPKTLPPAHKFSVDLFQYFQAGQYVCGSNRDYMERLIAHAQKAEVQGLVPILRRELFS